ncbi:MAG: FTR1 family iron permease [Candidatus Thorarchaeota archaeon]
MFVAPALVAFREGLEAALVIGIIFSYLKRTGRQALRPIVILSVILATATSIVFAMIFAAFWYSLEKSIMPLFEGFFILITAVLLTTMIIWMWTVGSRITTEIELAIEHRISKGESTSLAILSFSLVIREGVELVLFIYALTVQDFLQAIVGTVIGLVLAIIVGLGIYRGTLKIQLRLFFKWTSIFLVFIAAGMIAYSVHELQDGGLLLFGPLEVWNLNSPVLPDGSYPLLHENGILGGLAKTIFGYNGNPSAIEVLAYCGYLVLVTIYYLYQVRMKNQTHVRFSEVPMTM